MQPTRESNGANQLLFPYLALLKTGFTTHDISTTRRGLLHHGFTLTLFAQGGIVSVALSVGSLRPDVIGRLDSVELGLSSRHMMFRATASPTFTSIRL